MSALDDAREEVERKAQTSVDPALSPEEVEAILAKHLRYATWAAETVYEYDAKVIPPARTGQKFRAVQGGTSGAATPFSGRVSDFSQVSDGTVIWEEDGADSGSPYDVRGAIYEAWKLKASKASQFFDIGDARMSQVREHCKEEARAYAPVGVA